MNDSIFIWYTRTTVIDSSMKWIDSISRWYYSTQLLASWIDSISIRWLSVRHCVGYLAAYWNQNEQGFYQILNVHVFWMVFSPYQISEWTCSWMIFPTIRFWKNRFLNVFFPVRFSMIYIFYRYYSLYRWPNGLPGTAGLGQGQSGQYGPTYTSGHAVLAHGLHTWPRHGPIRLGPAQPARRHVSPLCSSLK